MTNAGGGVFHGLFANNWRKTGSMPFTLGKTIGIAINMDTNPRQIWITPDVTGTGGCGGGPLWNGDVNSAPVAHGGCGGPGTGQGTFGPGDTGLTGMGFFLAGAFPAWTGQDFSLPGSSVTFDFTDSATLDATIPTYLPWNTAGGSPSVSGPLNPMVRNIANAPARQQSTA